MSNYIASRSSRSTLQSKRGITRKEVSLSIIFEASMSAIILAFLKKIDLYITIQRAGPNIRKEKKKKKKLEIITFTDKTTSEHNYILIE